MGLADEMKNIAEDIVVAHDLRVKAVGDIVTDVHKTVKGFASDRKKMSAEQEQKGEKLSEVGYKKYLDNK